MRPLLTLAVWLLVTPASAAPPTVDAILDGVGPLSALRADPARVIRAVNRLQPMGRARGTAALRAWLKGKSNVPSGIFLVMRALFDGAATPPALGAPNPPPTDAERAHLPRFPLLILDDVPFSVVDGYLLGGLAEPPAMYLKRLEKTGTWAKRPLRPKGAGSVLSTLPHFGLYPAGHPVRGLIEGQLQRYAGPPPPLALTPHDPTRQGAPFFTVKGGRLPRPVVVPLWMQVTQADPDGKCPLHHAIAITARPDGSLYVEQYNSWCATQGAGCRLYDTARDAWTPLSACIDPGFGIHRGVHSLGGDWMIAEGTTEGGGARRLIRWTPERGQTVIADLAPDDTARWILGGVWVKSARPLVGPTTGARWYGRQGGAWIAADAQTVAWIERWGQAQP